MDSNARLPVEAAPGLVDQGNFFGCNLLTEPIGGDRTGEDKVRLASVADRLVGENAGDIGVEHHVVNPGVAVDAIGLLAQILIKPVDCGFAGGEAFGLIFELAEAAEDIVKLHRAVAALDRELNHERDARAEAVAPRTF